MKMINSKIIILKKIAPILIILFLISCNQDQSQQMISTAESKERAFIGEWESIAPEKRTNGTYGTRYFDLKEENWEVKFRLYLDSTLNEPVFEFRAIGKYNIEEDSKIIKDAFNAYFGFDQKFVTLLTDNETLIKNFGFNNCSLVKNVEKEITVSGCSFLKSKADCAQEYDLLK